MVLNGFILKPTLIVGLDWYLIVILYCYCLFTARNLRTFKMRHPLQWNNIVKVSIPYIIYTKFHCS